MQTVLWPILRQALRHPRRTAVIDDQRTWRYIDLAVGAMYLAEHIEKVTARQNVGVMLPTGGAFPLTALAAWMLGRTLVPVNYLLAEAERQYIVDHAEIDTLVTAGPMIEYLGGPPKNVKLIELEKMKFGGPPPLRFPYIAHSDDTAVILYTSGTSGRPKGVMLTHRNIRSNIDNSVRHMDLASTDGFVGVLPQFHSFGMTGLTLLPLRIGARIINTARFIPKKIIGLIRKHRPDIFMAIPSMYGALLTVKDAGREDLRSIRLAISGGEPLPRDIAGRFQHRFDIMIREGYGLTETSPIVAINRVNDARPGSVGKPIPGCDIRILDDGGGRLGPNEEGEITIAGPGIMAGYFRQPELTAEVLDDDGYFHTGDWGKVDDDGFVYITGRKKEMLIIGGENVFPREIEEVLNEHPAVQASAVVGRQDPVRGELPIAFVELEDNQPFDEAALRAFCRERLAGYKVPREVRPVEQMPRSPTGKILRRELPV